MLWSSTVLTKWTSEAWEEFSKVRVTMYKSQRKKGKAYLAVWDSDSDSNFFNESALDKVEIVRYNNYFILGLGNSQRVKLRLSNFQVLLSLVHGAVSMSSTALTSQFCLSRPSRLQ